MMKNTLEMYECLKDWLDGELRACKWFGPWKPIENDWKLKTSKLLASIFFFTLIFPLLIIYL